MSSKARYWQRIAQTYLLPGRSPLDFWHEHPEAHPKLSFDSLGHYYMAFMGKAAYAGPFDAAGVPMLDYRGAIGVRYNPIAVAQYGLALLNHYCDGDHTALPKALRQTDWLVENLKPNAQGRSVWMHDFDFEYRTTLRAPWYSGLAQGQGISLLARAFALTKEERYRTAMLEAFESLSSPVWEGGTLHTDKDGDPWIEEYIVAPPTHILNGFIWALWGVYDYQLSERDDASRKLFECCTATLEKHLPDYDTGYWSRYELSSTRLPMLASPFYHRLHIVQLEILARMTGRPLFREFSERWEAYSDSPLSRCRAFAVKCAFKALYY